MATEPNLEPQNPDMETLSGSKRDTIILEAINRLANEVERLRKEVEKVKSKI